MLSSFSYELKKESTTYLIGLAMALLVSIIVLSVAKMPSKFGFSFVCGALTFLLFVYLNRGSDQAAVKDQKNRFGFRFSSKLFIAILYFACLLIVLLIPSVTDAQFMSWLSIPLLNYVRLFAGVLLSSILPGYGLLELIDRKRHFRGLALLVFSFFSSFFLMGVLSFVCFVFNWGLASVYWLAIIANVAIFIGYSLAQVKRTLDVASEQKEVLFKLRIEYLIIACIFLFFIVGWVAYYSSYQLGSTGDMWDHYYTVLKVVKGGLFSTSHLSYLNAETWFSFHFISLFQLTGFPSLNSWMIYAFLNFFYILAFYLMVKAIVGENHPRVPIISTVITSLFAGFGWLVVMLTPSSDWGALLVSAGNKTYNDIIFSFIYGPIPQYVSLSILFVLLYLMFKNDEFSIASAILTVMLVAEGLLIHSPEIVFFVIFYYLFLFFAKRENFGRLKRFNISILIGLLIVFIVGLAFPSHFYFNMNILLPTLFVAISLTFLRFYIKPEGIRLSIPKFPKYVLVLTICLLWVFYLISFFAWNSTIYLGDDPTPLHLGATVTGSLAEVGLKPWYIYPVSSGVSLLLGLLGLTYLVLSNHSKLMNAKFLAISILLLFIAGIVISFVNINFISASTYWEKRLYSSFIVIPISIFGAFFVSELFAELHFKQTIKKLKYPFLAVASGLLICMIVLSGVGSNVLALDNVSIASQTDPLAGASKAELQALDYLRANASANSVVLGLSAASNRLVYTFSGLNHLTSVYWPPSVYWFNNLTLQYMPLQYMDTANPKLFLKTLYSLGINYLFATKSDLENLTQSGYLASNLIKYLPIVFQKDDVTIYTIPKLDPPSTESNLTLVMPEYMLNATLLSNAGMLENRTFNLPIDMLAESGLDYCIKYSGDGSIFDSNYLVLSSDRGWSSAQVNQYLDWVNNGGNLIVLNGDGLGSFAKILSISSKPNGTVLINKASNGLSIASIGNISVSSLFTRDNAVNVVANYSDESNQSVPLAFSKEEGKGEITYLDVNPLFNVLNSAKGTSWSYFKNMGALFNLLSLPTPVFQDTPADIRWKYIGYDSTFVGYYALLRVPITNSTIVPYDINIKSNSTIIPYDKFEVGALRLNNVTGSINGLPINQSLTFQNVTISNLIENGSLSSVIESKGEVDMFQSNYGSYSLLHLDHASNVSLQVPQQGISFSINATNGRERKISIVSGNVLLQNLTALQSSSILGNSPIPDLDPNDTRSFILARNPAINVTGQVFLAGASIPNYIRAVSGDSVLINGEVYFDFECSSDSVIVLNNFEYNVGYNGNFTTGRAPIKMTYWELTAVDWNSILNSSLFIICIAVVVFLILVMQPFYQMKIGKGGLSIEVQRKKDK